MSHKTRFTMASGVVLLMTPSSSRVNSAAPLSVSSTISCEPSSGIAMRLAILHLDRLGVYNGGNMRHHNSTCCCSGDHCTKLTHLGVLSCSRGGLHSRRCLPRGGILSPLPMVLCHGNSHLVTGLHGFSCSPGFAPLQGSRLAQLLRPVPAISAH